VSVLNAFSAQESRHAHNLGIAESAEDGTPSHALREMLERSNALNLKRAAKSFRIQPQRLQPNLSIRGTFRRRQTPYLNLRFIHPRFVTEILNQGNSGFSSHPRGLISPADAHKMNA
jgi:hypothetical protein